MDEQAAAERWVQERLDQVRGRPRSAGDLSDRAYEAQLRRTADAVRRPTQQYVGLALGQAEARAAQEGDHLCVHRGETGHRGSWRPDRVHVTLGPEDEVRTAGRDPAPWRW